MRERRAGMLLVVILALASVLADCGGDPAITLDATLTPDPVVAGEEVTVRIVGETIVGIDLVLVRRGSARYVLKHDRDGEPIVSPVEDGVVARRAAGRIPDASGAVVVTLLMPDDVRTGDLLCNDTGGPCTVLTVAG